MCLMRRLHLALLPWQFSLRQVFLDVIQPPPLWSSSPSFPRHLHPHQSLPYVFVSIGTFPFPYHFNLLSCTFFYISPTFVVPLILSFLILSRLATPLIRLDILISATSNFFSCAFFTAHVSAPYIIAGLTTVLYTLPLTLKLILRSHRIPDTLFWFFHPDDPGCILCVIFASKSPFSANVARRYWNVFTCSKFCPGCRLISEFPSKFPLPLNLR